MPARGRLRTDIPQQAHVKEKERIFRTGYRDCIFCAQQIPAGAAGICLGGERFMSSVSIEYHFSQAYQPFYISFLVVCLIIAIQVYVRIHANIGRESETQAFRRIIWVYVIYILVDLNWVIVACNTSDVTWILFLEYLESGILCLFTFSWFLFAETFIGGFPVRNVKTAPLYALPFAVTIGSTAYYCLNVSGLWGTPQKDSTLLYVINVCVDVFYLAFAFLHTLYQLLHEKRKTQRTRYQVILECILYPAVGAAISFCISYVPYIILGILPSIIKVLIEMQNANIYTDALTGINNRYRVNEFLERSWERCSERSPLRIYMIDVNKFKSINDTYGHLEGDRALVAVADALKKVASEGLVIGRFGGDEFILVDPYNNDPQRITNELRANLDEIAKAQSFPSRLTVSIGSAPCTNPDEPITAAQARADAALYADKKAQESA